MKKKVLNNFIKLVKYNWSTLILFELFHKGLALLIILPSIKLVLSSSMKSANIVYLSTDNIGEILTNPLSIILAILSIIILAFYMFFEFTSVIICFDKSRISEKITLFKLIKLSLRKSINILNPKNILLFVFVLLIVPLTNIALTSGFIGKIKLPEYILDYISSNIVLNIIYMVLILILYISVIRWIFSIHEVTLNTNSFKEARKKSASLTKGKAIKLILYSLGLSLIITVMGYIIYHVIIILIGIWTKNYTNANFLKDIFISRCIMFNDYAAFISSIAIFIISTGFISAFYYEYNDIRVYKKNLKKQKNSIKSVLKVTLKIVVILFILHIESMMYSLNNDILFNTSFFYNTTATAHRVSALVAPENTIAAFKETFITQAEYAEIDVQETKDGELILFHDSNFERVAGVNKNVWEVNYDEIKTYDVGSHFRSDFAGEKIPTLDEAMKYSKGKIKLLIEIKLNGHEKTDVEKRVLELIKSNRIDNQCVVASMNKNVLKRVKKLNPNMVTCYLTAVAYGNFYDWDYVDIYGIESTFINKKVVDNIHQKGKQVFVWTINSSKLMKKMIILNVDSIITDNPFLVDDAIYWQKNGFINRVANYLFRHDSDKDIIEVY
ncbi:glycerophosphodiester phosphodiesterase [Clostridioides sp. ES-S-0001-02]|uniref:glycerophosphoryl diester phosphodiesterase membrane domain-containing protein n=1 Tax=Clostridioides sp. ES-S-0001-02 TaxID=2770770 RepID=UPI001D10FFE0|nr:glycerophosphodiester phosphodiesterase [Clostridioides sp. ES-S-0001-02]